METPSPSDSSTPNSRCWMPSFPHDLVIGPRATRSRSAGAIASHFGAVLVPPENHSSQAFRFLLVVGRPHATFRPVSSTPAAFAATAPNIVGVLALLLGEHYHRSVRLSAVGTGTEH